MHLVLDGRDTTDPMFTRVVALQPGQPLSMRDVRETVLHLFAMGRFDDVRVDATREGAGVAVRLVLTATHPVSAIEFAGDIRQPGIDEGQLRRAVVDRAGPSPPVSRVDEWSRLVEAALRARGYLNAKVTGRPDLAAASNKMTLVFTVEPGPRAVIGSINVTGAEAVRSIFLSQVDVAAGKPFERDALLARIEKYVANRRSHGYYEAKATLMDQPVDGGRRVDVTFNVEPGRHVRVVFTGDAVPGNAQELVPVEREGSVDEDLLEDATARIEDALKAQGYKDATAPHQRQEGADELVITFNVTRGQEYRVSDVAITGNAFVPLADLQAGLRLRQGQPFSQAALDAEAATIEDIYRRSGFGSARADTEVKPQPSVSGEVPVVVTIAVIEGARTLVGSVKVTGNTSIAEGTLLDGLRLQPGRPFVVAGLAADRDAIRVRYLNSGYENATVEAVPPAFNRDRTQADIVYAVREGPQVLVDHVLIVGTDRTDVSTVEKQLQLHAGDPLSRDAVLDSQRRVQSLGLYRTVTISELRHGEENRRDLLVSVEEGPSTSVAYGGGAELRRRVVTSDTGDAVEQFDVAPRASFQITERNLFGTNRSASAYASITLHPQGTAQSGTTEYRVVGTFREPQIFDTKIDGTILLTVEQQFRSSFNFRRRGVTAEASRRLSPRVSVIGSYQLERTETYDVVSDQSLIDRVFANVRLSSFSLSVLRDTRNDPVDPSNGEYYSAHGQLAAKAIGSEVGFVKSFFQASAFRPVPHSKRIVLAGNAFLGLATGFPQVDASGRPLIDALGQPLRDLPQSERFYAGGATTMRGFDLDLLGVRHTPPQRNDTIDADGFPLGGNAESLFNFEVRVATWRAVETHGFVDTGNVFNRVVNLDLTEFRTAYGFGVLYKSPVGPIRFDIGFKVNPQPGESLNAYFITFGRAF